MNDRIVKCQGCKKEIDWNDLVEVYDDCGIYAGKWCSYECAEQHLNLHMTRQDYAECGECIDDDY